MQLFAWDKQRRLVSASRADRQRDYTCCECEGQVRVRGGFRRRIHFYHLAPPSHCRQSGKSLVHLHIQCLLQEWIPGAVLERRFPEIARIADVCWEEEKLVFEVQFSPITAKEVRDRNRDYASVGYSVVWLLHTRKFARWRITAAEWILRDQPYYYTNLNLDGRGLIYDQFDTITFGRRHDIVRPFPVNLTQVRRYKGEVEGVPNEIARRMTRRMLGFGGDIVDCYLTGNASPRLEAVLRIDGLRKRVEQRRKWRLWLSYLRIDLYIRMIVRLMMEQVVH